MGDSPYHRSSASRGKIQVKSIDWRWFLFSFVRWSTFWSTTGFKFILICLFGKWQYQWKFSFTDRLFLFRHVLLFELIRSTNLISSLSLGSSSSWSISTSKFNIEIQSNDQWNSTTIRDTGMSQCVVIGRCSPTVSEKNSLQMNAIENGILNRHRQEENDGFGSLSRCQLN